MYFGTFTITQILASVNALNQRWVFLKVEVFEPKI